MPYKNLKLPKFNSRGIKLAEDAVKWLYNNFELEQIDLGSYKFGRSTINDLLKSRKIPSTFSCIEKASVVAAAIINNGGKAWIVSERMESKGEPVTIHFPVEGIDHEGNKFSIDLHASRTDINKNWLGKKIGDRRKLEMSGGGKDTGVINTILGRHEITRESFDRTLFSNVGIKGKLHYAWMLSPKLFIRAKERKRLNEFMKTRNAKAHHEKALRHQETYRK